VVSAACGELVEPPVVSAACGELVEPPVVSAACGELAESVEPIEAPHAHAAALGPHFSNLKFSNLKFPFSPTEPGRIGPVRSASCLAASPGSGELVEPRGAFSRL
jgi:hypothetical protein